MKLTIVFDVDGTLVNTLPHIYTSYCKACDKFRVKQPLIETLRKEYDQSNNFRNTAIAIGVPLEKVDEFNYTVYEFFKKEIRINKPELIPEAEKIIYSLESNEVDLKILSLELYENTVYKLGESLAKRFSEIILPHNGKEHALRELAKRNDSKIIYIGDCVSDGVASISAGVEFIGLATPYSFSHEEKMIKFIKENVDRAKCAIIHAEIISIISELMDGIWWKK